MKELDQIVGLLADEALEKRIAAVIVLGELRPKTAEVAHALLELATGNVAVLQKHALEALAKIGAKRVVAKLFPLLMHGDREVREAARRAIASVGVEVVPLIRTRMSEAKEEERRHLDAILAELGGKDAFTALLASLTASDAEAAKAAAVAVRQRVKSADPKEHKSYLAETERFLEKQDKKGGSPAAIAAAVKILGYLEDEKAIDTILAYAADKKQAPLVRQEAIIALRYPLQKKIALPKAVAALCDAAAAEDRTLAQAALMTLGGLTLSAAQAHKLEKLLAHPEIERAHFVIEQLGRQKDADAAKLLVQVVAEGEKKRAELAVQALGQNMDALPFLTKALLSVSDPDRAWMIRNLIRPFARKITPAAKKQILSEAIEGLSAGSPGWESLLGVARDADPEGAAESLRELAHKLKKSKKSDKALAVLGILGKSELATVEDIWALAALELGKSAKDMRPHARANDEALKLCTILLRRSFDLFAALKKERSLGLDELYYVGFHFVELGHPIGADLLAEVVKKAGRSKLAKMAKNKLALAAA